MQGDAITEQSCRQGITSSCFSVRQKIREKASCRGRENHGIRKVCILVQGESVSRIGMVEGGKYTPNSLGVSISQEGWGREVGWG